MLQQSYGIKRISGMGVGLVTFLSVASVSSNALNASVTAGTTTQSQHYINRAMQA